MMPRNLSIRALESFPALRSVLDSPAVHSLANTLEAALLTAPTFLMPSGLFADRKDIAKLTSLIRLPVDCLFLETEDVALLAMRSTIPALPDSIMVWPVVDGRMAPTGFSVHEAYLPTASETRQIPTTPLHLLPNGAAFLERAGANGYFSRHLAALGELCALLACRNVETVRVAPPERLNKARIARGKLPLPAYHTLVIRLSETRQVGGGSAGGHASPRSHLRRGHIRQLPGGPVWVSAAVVNPGHGWIAKRYALKA